MDYYSNKMDFVCTLLFYTKSKRKKKKCIFLFTFSWVTIQHLTLLFVFIFLSFYFLFCVSFNKIHSSSSVCKSQKYSSSFLLFNNLWIVFIRTMNIYTRHIFRSLYAVHIYEMLFITNHYLFYQLGIQKCRWDYNITLSLYNFWFLFSVDTHNTLYLNLMSSFFIIYRDHKWISTLCLMFCCVSPASNKNELVWSEMWICCLNTNLICTVWRISKYILYIVC